MASQDSSALRNNYYFDVFTLHIYFKTETVHELIALHQQMIMEAGLNKPLWLNETNAPPMDDPESPWLTPLFPVTLEQQASFVVQSVALAFGAGAERVAVYKLRDATMPEPGYEPYGLFSYSASPRPASVAYGEVIRHLSGFRSVNHDATPGYHLVTFENDIGTAFVAWARNSTSVSLTLFSDTWDAITIYNKYGEPQTIVPDESGFHTLILPPADCPEMAGCVVGGDPFFVLDHTTSDAGLLLAGSSIVVVEGDSWQRIVQRTCIDDIGWQLDPIEIVELADLNRSRNSSAAGEVLRAGKQVGIACWHPELSHH